MCVLSGGPRSGGNIDKQQREIFEKRRLELVALSKVSRKITVLSIKKPYKYNDSIRVLVPFENISYTLFKHCVLMLFITANTYKCHTRHRLHKLKQHRILDTAQSARLHNRSHERITFNRSH